MARIFGSAGISHRGVSERFHNPLPSDRRRQSPVGVLVVRNENLIWVVMPSGDKFVRFFVLRMTTEPKNPGAVIPRRSFTTAWVMNGPKTALH